MLTIENLTKKYGNKVAVRDLSLHIGKGQICAFIGHNGAGKTTTIKCVCGIQPFDRGQIRIDGNSIQKDPIVCKKKMAYVPDNPDLYDFMTGIQYLNFIADVYELGGTLRKERIQEYAEQFQLTTVLGQSIASYSHGMKQKLTLIGALIHDPALMILDEPFVGLDPAASRTIKDIMLARCKQGSTVLFSTHILEVAERLCDTVAIMKEGKLIAYGEMEKVIGNSTLEEVFLREEEHI